MQQRDLLTKRLKMFYEDIQPKRKGNKMHLQADVEFPKHNIKDLNKKFNVEMFSTKIRGGKAFAAEQKIRKLKNRLSNLNLIKSKLITPNKLISKLTANMNEVASEKYGLSRNYIERQLLQSEGYYFDQIRVARKSHKYLNKYDVNLYSQKKRNLDLI